MNNKYRGKLIETGEWVYGYLIGTDVIVGEIVVWEDEYFHTEFWCSVDPDTVGQYVGRKDKNGKEIYSGMDLRFWTGPEQWPDGYTTGTVTYNTHICTYQLHDKGRHILFDIDDWDIEIVEDQSVLAPKEGADKRE
ncbi:YopX family protein [Paenibacillus sp. 7516]|uniref:YopX family protein n=1 Tax=Paenibacillus sp. 7516 TaxID=2022549 RepID=UPI000BA580D5|nr:YopX family protein [Paenibacillus sp. 7516]PAF31884.1 hypothetical protein CHI14_09535 [Paenibacillus sp. 7516]